MDLSQTFFRFLLRIVLALSLLGGLFDGSGLLLLLGFEKEPFALELFSLLILIDQAHSKESDRVEMALSVSYRHARML